MVRFCDVFMGGCVSVAVTLCLNAGDIVCAAACVGVGLFYLYATMD